MQVKLGVNRWESETWRTSSRDPDATWHPLLPHRHPFPLTPPATLLLIAPSPPAYFSTPAAPKTQCPPCFKAVEDSKGPCLSQLMIMVCPFEFVLPLASSSAWLPRRLLDPWGMRDDSSGDDLSLASSSTPRAAAVRIIHQMRRFSSNTPKKRERGHSVCGTRSTPILPLIVFHVTGRWHVLYSCRKQSTIALPVQLPRQARHAPDYRANSHGPPHLPHTPRSPRPLCLHVPPPPPFTPPPCKP